MQPASWGTPHLRDGVAGRELETSLGSDTDFLHDPGHVTWEQFESAPMGATIYVLQHLALDVLAISIGLGPQDPQRQWKLLATMEVPPSTPRHL